MTVDATGTLRDTAIMGGALPQLAFEAHLAGGALTARAQGEFQGFDPAAVSGRKEVAGKVSGLVDATVKLADISAPITPDAIAADGTVSLTRSSVGGLEIESAAVQGKYASQVGEVTKLQVAGPDLKVDAAGRLALDRTSQSNLKYHIEATDLAELSRLAGQQGIDGSAVLDGTLTGNAALLQPSGRMVR